MKRLHRRDLFSWAVYSEKLDVDFNGFAWIREGLEGGNVLIDPVPMTPHDRAHLAKLGGAGWIILTNGDHLRAARELAAELGAKIAGPAAEREKFPVACDKWIADRDEPFPGLVAIALDGSKTPGELALVLDETTLLCGDLVRAHRAGSLMLLLDQQGLKDRAKAAASIERLHALPKIEAVLVGDGWCVFRDGRTLLGELAASLRGGT
jgi:glyoxylase-like metal-dependent hydrolase (beta-lactamase superfamily II)